MMLPLLESRLPPLESLNEASVAAADIRPGGPSAWIVQAHAVKEVWEFACRGADLKKKYAILEALTVDQLQEFLTHLLNDEGHYWASLNALLTLLKPTTEPSIIYQAAKSKIMGGLTESRIKEAGKTCQPENIPIISQILENYPDRQQWLLEGHVDNQGAKLQTLLIQAFTATGDRVTINPDSINPFQKSLLNCFGHNPQYLESFICVFVVFASTSDSTENTESFLSWYIGKNAESIRQRLREIETAVITCETPSVWLLHLKEQIRNYLILKKNSARLCTIGSTIPIDDTSLFFEIMEFFKTDITSQELVTRTHIRNDVHRLIPVLSACADNTELRNLVVTRLGKENAVTIIGNPLETAESIRLLFDMITAFKKNADVQASIIQAYVKNDPHRLIRVLSACAQNAELKNLVILRLGKRVVTAIISSIPDDAENVALFLDIINAFSKDTATQTLIAQTYIKDNLCRLVNILSACNQNIALRNLVIVRLGKKMAAKIINDITGNTKGATDLFLDIISAFTEDATAQTLIAQTYITQAASIHLCRLRSVLFACNQNTELKNLLILRLGGKTELSKNIIKYTTIDLALAKELFSLLTGYPEIQRSILIAFSKIPSAPSPTLHSLQTPAQAVSIPNATDLNPADDEQGIVSILRTADSTVLIMLIPNKKSLVEMLSLIKNVSERFALFSLLATTCPTQLRDILKSTQERDSINFMVTANRTEYQQFFSRFFQPAGACSTSFLWAQSSPDSPRYPQADRQDSVTATRRR